MRTPRTLTLAAAALLSGALAGPAAAQREGYTFLSYVGSDVSLVSKSLDEETARVNTPVLSGDRLSTGNASRAEVILASGNVVRVDGRSELRFDRMARTYESEDERDLLYLERGALFVDVRDAQARDRAFRVDTDDATVVVPGGGAFRVDAGRRGTEVYAVSGEIEVSGRGGSARLRAGQLASIRGDEEIEVEDSDLPRDRFTRFVEDRRGRLESSQPTSYVPAEYEVESDAASFDDYGSWVYVSDWNRYCWRPTVVADWRPYSAGYWRWTPGGLTWVSYEPWGWLPYHYGTWGFDASFGWCWIPGSAYSPAWVYWSYTPSWVGWCPIGYYGYHDAVHRSTRRWHGSDGGHVRYPRLRGRVEVTQVDPRGWNYTSVSRLGARLDPARDIVRGERVGFRPGETAVIATSPLRIDRASGTAPAVVQDAVRRVATESAEPRGGGTAPVNEGLTALLRRDPRLSPSAEQELRRVPVARGGDQGLRPLSPDQVVRESPSRAADPPIRVMRDGGRTVISPGRGTRPDASRDEGWRSPSSPAPRAVEPRAVARPTRDDSGWRAPRYERDRGSVTRRQDWREAPPAREASPRGSTAYRPARVAPREAPVTRDAPAQRREAPRYEAPRDAAPRQAPAPRSEASRYEPPRHEAPRQAPAPAPRVGPPSAPAPAPAQHAAPAAPRGSGSRR